MTGDFYPQMAAVVFDFDGTLADTRIDFDKMRRRVYDLLKDWDLWEEGMGDQRYVLEVIAAARAKLAPAEERMTEFQVQADRVLVEVEMETVAAAAPYPGVPEALAHLVAAGLRIGIVTRNCRACVADLLARHPLPYEVCLTRDDVALVKPDPAHLWAALADLAVAPEVAIMVGDHRSDIECARAAGCRSVGVLTTGTTREQFHELGADAAYDTVADFVQAFCTTVRCR